MTHDFMQDLLKRHFDAWTCGDVAGLLADYAEDAAVISAAGGAIVGRNAIAAMLAKVFDSLFPPSDTRLDITDQIVFDNHALVHWTATTSTIRTVGGFDAFTVQHGKIAAQYAGAQIVALTHTFP